jgi:glycosyltransferase involved in cell wall biosynthesis
VSLTVVVPDRSAQEPSGGDRYDAAIVAQWRRGGRPVEVVSVAGAWPWPTAQDQERLERALRAASAGGPVLVDGLVGCSAPEVVARVAARRPVVLLVHALLADGAGAGGAAARELDRRERRALEVAGAVVTISGWAGRQLSERHGITHADVAPPGTDPAAVSPGSLDGTGVPALLSLGAITPLKNHAMLLAALEQVAELPWTLTVAGPAPDAGHLAALEADAVRHRLCARVDRAGPLVGDRLEAAWAATDLLVHPSRSETYAMVVSEAFAHGIPAVVGAGTGAVEALAGGGGAAGGRAAVLPGAAVRTDRPEQLADVLRRWLSEAPLRRRWREAALARRSLLTGWDRTVEQIDRVLDRITP